MSCCYGSPVDQSSLRDNYGSLHHSGPRHEPINPLLPLGRLEDQVRAHQVYTPILPQGSYASESPHSAQYAVASGMYKHAQFPALSTMTMARR